jgi:hypothetical protein
MFGVLYAASPEVFPGKHRGTGNGLTATAARVFSVLVRSLLPGTDMSPWFNYARVRAGSHYCIVREPQNGGTRLYRWRAPHRRRWSCALASF